jgi:hypothetical protein
MLAPDVVIVVGASSPDGSRRDVHCVLCRCSVLRERGDVMQA